MEYGTKWDMEHGAKWDTAKASAVRCHSFASKDYAFD